MENVSNEVAYALGRMEAWLEEYARKAGRPADEFKAELGGLLANGTTGGSGQEYRRASGASGQAVTRKKRGPYGPHKVTGKRGKLGKPGKPGPRGWGNMTAAERSEEMRHRQRVAKGLEPPRKRASQANRPAGGVA